MCGSFLIILHVYLLARLVSHQSLCFTMYKTKFVHYIVSSKYIIIAVMIILYLVVCTIPILKLLNTVLKLLDYILSFIVELFQK